MLLEVKNLTKKFGSVTAANNINFKMNENEIIGVIGANGAGKTTFCNIITGYLKPDSGVILYEGKNITKFNGYKEGSKTLINLSNYIFKNTDAKFIMSSNPIYIEYKDLNQNEFSHWSIDSLGMSPRKREELSNFKKLSVLTKNESCDIEELHKNQFEIYPFQIM